MATTAWRRPRAVNYYSDQGSAWTGVDGDFAFIENLASEALVSTANSLGRIITTDSRSLVFRDWGFDNVGEIQGIELETVISRWARIVDQQVQLIQGSELLGQDQRTATTEDRQVYGGSSTLWGADTVDYTATDFGLVLDLAANPLLPCNDRPIITLVRMRLHY